MCKLPEKYYHMVANLVVTSDEASNIVLNEWHIERQCLAWQLIHCLTYACHECLFKDAPRSQANIWEPQGINYCQFSY